MLSSRQCLHYLLAALAAVALCGLARADEPTKPAAKEDSPSRPEAPKRPPRPGDVQRVFVIQHVEPVMLGEVLAAFPATITYSRYGGSKGLGVSAAPAVMAAIEETVKRLDVPPPRARDVEITAYVIEGLPEVVAGASVPERLAPVVSELRPTFRYVAYRLADTLIARATAGSDQGFQTDGYSDSPVSSDKKDRYQLNARWVNVAQTEGRSFVRLRRLFFRAKLGLSDTGSSDVTISTDVDIPDGQMVVVGKAGTGQDGKALILVLSAKVVD